MSYINISNTTIQAELKTETSFFHAMGKVFIKQGQNVFESDYKSSHNVLKTEIWTSDVPHALNSLEATSHASTMSQITKHENVRLYPLFGSNQQIWFYDLTAATFGTSDANAAGYKPQSFARPWISPVDAPHIITNKPSYGYNVELKDGNGTVIGQGDGTWEVDFYVGMIHFAVGNTPNVSGWGIESSPTYDTTTDTNYPTLTFYQYTGNFLSNDLSTIGKGFDTNIIICTMSTTTPNNDNNNLFLQGVSISDYKEYTMLDIEINGVPLKLKTISGTAPTIVTDGECYFGTSSNSAIGLTEILALTGSYNLYLAYTNYTGTGKAVTQWDLEAGDVISINYTKKN